MLVLFTDTDTDVTKKKAEELGYQLISMPYCIDGKEIRPYVDFDEFDAKTFYQSLRDGTMPTTSAINEREYIQYFEPYFKNGDDILYVHFSRAMSMSFDNMDRAVRDLSEKYTKTKFYEIDTKGITICSYRIVLEVAKMYKEGMSAEKIVEKAEKLVDKTATYFFADDLKFFRKSGRVSGLAATMGTLVGIRPIIYMNDEGKMTSIGKEKGRMKAMKRLVAYVDELGDDIKNNKIIIGNAGADEFVITVRDMLIEKYGKDLDVEIMDVNPTAGSHCGPNSMGICFNAIHR